jgi:hypothetical protein
MLASKEMSLLDSCKTSTDRHIMYSNKLWKGGEMEWALSSGYFGFTCDEAVLASLSRTIT